MPGQTDPTVRVLDELGRVIRQLTRLSGGPDDGPALTATQRLALFELLEDGPMRLNDLAGRMGTSAPDGQPGRGRAREARPRRAAPRPVATAARSASS